MTKKPRQKPESHQRIAKERIKILFHEADSVEDPDLATRYVQLARKLSMKYKVKLTSEQKRKFCKHCYVYLKPGKNCRVRIQDNKLIYYCANCEKYYRIPLKPKKKV